jgi:Ca-activated chloride channel family protein
MFSEIYFEFPDLLHLLWVIPLQALLLWVYWRWRQQTLRLMGSQALEERLLLGFSARRFWSKNVLFGLGLALVALAIAGPVRMVKEKGKEQHSADVLIALDVSNSMMATDVKPSRLDQAKAFIQKLVQALEGERIALVFFAGEAYPQMPLSTDYEALLMFTRNANPDFITDQGTDIGAAIELGKRMLETDKETGRAIILISDGENHEEKALQRVREAHEAGVQIFTVGIGLSAGAAIPEGNGAFQRDFTGKTVKSAMDEAMLVAVAKAGGGLSLQARDENRSIETLKKAVNRLQKSALEASQVNRKVYYFPWLLLAALMVLIAEQILWWKKKDR